MGNDQASPIGSNERAAGFTRQGNHFPDRILSFETGRARPSSTSAGTFPAGNVGVTVVDQLKAQCEALGAEVESLREQLRQMKESVRKERDPARTRPERSRKPRPVKDVPIETGPYVRPYAMTKGRTIPRRHMAIEALVSTTVVSPDDPSLMTPEYHDISLLCCQPRSIAEISSLLGIPLGVARVLVADMADESLVRIHQTPSDSQTLDRTLLEKVLAGLRKL